MKIDITAAKGHVIAALRNTPNAHPMWIDKAVELVKLLHGAGLDMQSDTLLNDMIEASQNNKQVRLYLENLPGVAVADWALVDKHFSPCSMLIRQAFHTLGSDLNRIGSVRWKN